MTVDTTVVTPSIPTRLHLLAEAMASVQAQTVSPAAHLIRVQQPTGGLSVVHVAHQYNVLIRAASTEFVSFLDDDDVYLSHHFETIQSFLDDPTVDVVLTEQADGYKNQYNSEWSREKLLEVVYSYNPFVANAAVRRSTLDAVGGFDETTFENGYYASGVTHSDWDLWVRLAEHGAKFVVVSEATFDRRYGEWDQVCSPS